MKKIIASLILLVLLIATPQQSFADLYQDGVAAYRNSNYQLAEYYFREAIKIFPDNSNYRYYLAITLVQRGNIFEAEEQYRKVMELAPGTEAANKASRGIALIASAKRKFIKDQEPSPMVNVVTPAPNKVVISTSRNNNAIIVPNVVINNRLGVNFILDTGATYTSISRKTAMDLNRMISLKTANGVIQVPKVTLGSININGLEAKNVEVTIHDLPAANNVTGLLGLSFLEQFMVTIDKRNHRIILESI